MENIKEYYTSTFPTDELGQEINPKANFDDLIDELNFCRDVYEYLGVSDSLIRERVFEKLAEREGFSYEDVYNQWLFANN